VNRNEQIRTRIVRDRSSLLERNKGVVTTRQNDLQPIPSEAFREAIRDVENELLFEQARRAAGAHVIATVPGVNDDGVESIGPNGFVCASQRRRERSDHNQRNSKSLPFELQPIPPRPPYHGVRRFACSRASLTLASGDSAGG
jgi:hypothetical protein